MRPVLAGATVLFAAFVVRRSWPASRTARIRGRLDRAVVPGPSHPRLVPAVASAVERARGGRAASLDRQLPDALEHLARSLRAGRPLRDAIAAAGAATGAPLGEHLAELADDLALGRPTVDAMRAWAVKVDRPGARLAAAALRLGTERGGSRARAVDRVARSLRDRLAVQRELVALSAQARLSALLMALAPVAFALLTAAVDRGSAAVLLGTPLGWSCLAGAALLDLVAALWMARLVRPPSP